jgi:hypothetical protein
MNLPSVAGSQPYSLPIIGGLNVQPNLIIWPQERARGRDDQALAAHTVIEANLHLADILRIRYDPRIPNHRPRRPLALG